MQINECGSQSILGNSLVLSPLTRRRELALVVLALSRYLLECGEELHSRAIFKILILSTL